MINPLASVYEWFMLFTATIPLPVLAFLGIAVFLAVISALFRWFL